MRKSAGRSKISLSEEVELKALAVEMIKEDATINADNVKSLPRLNALGRRYGVAYILNRIRYERLRYKQSC